MDILWFLLIGLIAGCLALVNDLRRVSMFNVCPAFRRGSAAPRRTFPNFAEASSQLLLESQSRRSHRSGGDGWLAGLIMRGGGYGILGNMVVGIIGALIGGFLFRLVGLSAYGTLGSIVTAVIGAILFIFVLRVLQRT